MYIVICGCGRVGAQLATMLSNDEHNVVVIDIDPEALRELGTSFNGLTVVGNGFDEETLEAAGIRSADIFIAVTSQDNVNIMAGQVAMKLFNVPKVISRVYYPDREQTYHKLGVNTVCGTVLVAQKIREMVLEREFVYSINLDDRTQLAEVNVVTKLIGKRVSDIEIPGEFRPLIVMRDGKSQVVSADTVIAKDDTLIVAVDTAAAETIKKRYGIELWYNNTEGLISPI